MREIYIKNEDDTKAFAAEVAHNIEPGSIIALIGDLGTGKTAFTRHFASALGVKEMVNSPTFTIVKEYHSGELPLYHFDVYRVNDPDELFEIGYEEYFYGKGVCIVEWADLIEDLLPENTKTIYIEYGPEEGERIYRCTF